MTAYTNPQPSDPRHSSLKAALQGRGVVGTLLWFLLLAGGIVAVTLAVSQCDDDEPVAATDEVAAGDDAEAAPTPEPEPTATPAPTSTPEPTATPSPTATPAPTATPEPTPAPDVPADVAADVDGGSAVLRGVVPDQDTADALVAAAESVLGAGNVSSELEIDPDATADDATLTLSGNAEEATAAQLRDALVAAYPGAAVVDGALEIQSSEDVVAELNALFAANPVQFAPGSAEILDESVPVLDEVADLLGRAPGLALEVQGHTDAQGDEQSNQLLSLNRANSVITYLVDAGVAEDRLSPVGFGESRPVADNDTEAGRQANRRIEFAIIDGG